MHPASDTGAARAETIPNPSRRSLFATAASAVLAGAAIATTAHAAPGALPGPAGDDAEMIAACDRLVANRTAWVTLIMSRHSIEDERRTEPENDRLCAEHDTILDQIEATPATATLAGAQALARAALADAQRAIGGHWEAREHPEWLALLAAEFLAGASFENDRVQLARAANRGDAAAGRAAT